LRAVADGPCWQEGAADQWVLEVLSLHAWCGDGSGDDRVDVLL
jgi:hypothetical protein